MAATRSIYGPKPSNCPAQFDRCGDCNVYPCFIYELAPAEGEHMANVSIQKFISIECSRRALNGTFRRPTLEHALMFLLAEAGEVMDAYLRTPELGAKYFRSHVRLADLPEELADVVFMAYVCANIIGVDLDELIRKKWEA